MTLELVVRGAPRTKGNHGRRIKRGGRIFHVTSEQHQEWKQLALQRMKDFLCEHDAILPVKVQMNVRALIYRVRAGTDLDNHFKAIGDLLQEAGVIANDRLLTWDGSRALKDKDNPRIEMTLTWSE